MTASVQGNKSKHTRHNITRGFSRPLTKSGLSFKLCVLTKLSWALSVHTRFNDLDLGSWSQERPRYQTESLTCFWGVFFKKFWSDWVRTLYDWCTHWQHHIHDASSDLGVHAEWIISVSVLCRTRYVYDGFLRQYFWRFFHLSTNNKNSNCPSPCPTGGSNPWSSDLKSDALTTGPRTSPPSLERKKDHNHLSDNQCIWNQPQLQIAMVGAR